MRVKWWFIGNSVTERIQRLNVLDHYVIRYALHVKSRKRAAWTRGIVGLLCEGHHFLLVGLREKRRNDGERGLGTTEQLQSTTHATRSSNARGNFDIFWRYFRANNLTISGSQELAIRGSERLGDI